MATVNPAKEGIGKPLEVAHLPITFRGAGVREIMNQCNATDRAVGVLNLMELRFLTQDQEEQLLALHVR